MTFFFSKRYCLRRVNTHNKLTNNVIQIRIGKKSNLKHLTYILFSIIIFVSLKLINFFFQNFKINNWKQIQTTKTRKLNERV